MTLQLILIQKSIDTYAEAKELSDIQQKQMVIELKAYFGKKTSLREAFREGECMFDFWQVVDVAQRETVLYDFWELNADSGGVFYTGTVNETGVEMIQGSFGVQEKFLKDENAKRLAEALEEAERIKPVRGDFEFNELGEITKFKVDQLAPQNAKEWKKFLKNQKLSEGLVREHHANFDKSCWKLICQTTALSEAFMLEFARHMDWVEISEHQRLSESFIRTKREQLNWAQVSLNQPMSEGFLREFQEVVDWGYLSISSKQTLSEPFIEEFGDKLSWKSISWSQKFSEEFIRKHQDKIDWSNLFTYREFPEAFIREFVPRYDWNVWYAISGRQSLSNAFINEFAESINWHNLSMNHSLTDEQLRLYKDKLVWSSLIIFGRSLSEDLLREFQDYISQSPQMTKHNWDSILKNKAKFPISKEFRQEIQQIIKTAETSAKE